MVMRAADDDAGTVRVIWEDTDTELLRYVYAPGEEQVESPRPFFHPVRTLRGELASLYRPHDHVWHKGISWSLPNVGSGNFWGGPTYQRGRGYRQLPNNGRIRHLGFGRATVRGALLRLDEDLSWVTEQGETWFRERRRIGAVAWPREGAWVLAFETHMRNVSGAAIAIGSPTTKGRENAGYGGLFWRGPRSFTGGTILAPGYAGGEQIRGARAQWMGYTGQHDQSERHSSLVMVDDAANPQHPPQWFVRNEMFAGVN